MTNTITGNISIKSAFSIVTVDYSETFRPMADSVSVCVDIESFAKMYSVAYEAQSVDATINETGFILSLSSSGHKNIVGNIVDEFPFGYQVSGRSGVILSGTFAGFSISGIGHICHVATVTDTFPGYEVTAHGLTGILAHMDQSFQFMDSMIHSCNAKTGNFEAGMMPMDGSTEASIDIVVTDKETFPYFIATGLAMVSVIITISETFQCMTDPVESEIAIPLSTIAATHAGTTVTVPDLATYCFNILNKCVSRFTNYNFYSYATINGGILGGKSDGLYNMVGDTDNGTSIISVIKTPLIDFGTYLFKKLRGARLGGRFDGAMTVTADNGTDTWDATFVTIGGQIPENNMAYYPYQARGKYLEFTIENDGSMFLMNDLNLYMMILERR